MRNKIFEAIFYTFGLLMLALGVTLTLLSNLGAGGWDALTTNISKILGIPVGMGVFVLGTILVFSTAILERKFPNFITLGVSFITGIFIDFWYYTIFKEFNFSSFQMRLVIVILGVIIIGIGCAMIFATTFPKNHTESFIFAVSRKYNLIYKNAKVKSDIAAFFIAMALGFMLGDLKNIGIGTIFNTFFTGYIIHFILPYINRIYKKMNKILN